MSTLPAPVRALGYARVSTDRQGDSGAGLDAQERAIRDHAAREGWELLDLVREIGTGRTMARRPLLAELLERLEDPQPGAPRVLLAAKLDRISRSTIDAGRLFERSKEQGWAIVALDLGVDTSTPAGELVANVMVSVAQWERRVIGERTRAALAEKREAGVALGRRRALPPQSAARMHELRAAGGTTRTIARALNEEGVPGAQGGRWHPSTVGDALRRYPPPPAGLAGEAIEAETVEGPAGGGA